MSISKNIEAYLEQANRAKRFSSELLKDIKYAISGRYFLALIFHLDFSFLNLYSYSCKST